jgi:hypothetical protein
MFSHGTVGGHQVKCLHIPQKCPVSKLAFGNCSWTGSYSDIKGHLKENHLEECYEYVEGDFKYLYRLTSGMKFFCFIFAYSEIFFYLFQQKDHIFYNVLLYVGPAENAAKYKYKVEFVNEDNTEGVTIMYVTRCYDEDLDKVYGSGGCGKWPYEVMNYLKDKEGNVKFRLEIVSVSDL